MSAVSVGPLQGHQGHQGTFTSASVTSRAPLWRHQRSHGFSARGLQVEGIKCKNRSCKGIKGVKITLERVHCNLWLQSAWCNNVLTYVRVKRQVLESLCEGVKGMKGSLRKLSLQDHHGHIGHHGFVRCIKNTMIRKQRSSRVLSQWCQGHHQEGVICVIWTLSRSQRASGEFCKHISDTRRMPLWRHQRSQGSQERVPVSAVCAKVVQCVPSIYAFLCFYPLNRHNCVIAQVDLYQLIRKLDILGENNKVRKDCYILEKLCAIEKCSW